MNPFLFAALGFLGGLVFGLAVAWGWVGLLVAAIGVVVLLAGSLLPTMFRGLFGLAVIGFLLSFIIAGGLTLL
jgi:hypothetical protein